jgi:hypothetical protein
LCEIAASYINKTDLGMIYLRVLINLL